MRLLFFVLLFNAFNAQSEVIDLKFNKELSQVTDPSNRKNDAPFITVDSFRFITEHQFDEASPQIDTDEIEAGDIIFVKTKFLDQFFNKVYPQIKVPFILLSHADDKEGATKKYLKHLDNENFKLWATVNCENPYHPKVIPLPLGIIPNSHRAVFNSINIFDLPEIITRVNSEPKSKFCLVNFGTLHKRRHEVLEIMKNKEYATIEPRMTNKDYFENLGKYAFCISPRGVGMDCFRVWESLLVGCIPVVEHSFLDPLFYNLPIMIIDNYESLEREDLEKTLEDFKTRSFDLKKIYVNYYIKFLQRIQDKLRDEEDIAKEVKKFKRKAFGIISKAG